MNDDLPPWVTEGIPDDPDGPIGPIFIPPSGCSAVYDYIWPDETPAFKVVRWEPNGTGKKRFQQWGLEGNQWVPKQTVPAGERPLYGICEVNQYFGANVLIVEGEKTAIAARVIVPSDWVVVTWAGGSSAVDTADWSPLKQHNVRIWPDNDEPGISAAKKIAEKLDYASIIDPPLAFPEGWDLADAPPEGWDTALLIGKIIGKGNYEKLDQSTDQERAAKVANSANVLTFDPITWHDQPIVARKWLVDGLIPFHVATMLSGMGGLGKTLLGIQLAHASVTGHPWIGRGVTQVKAFGVFCEDDKDELHRRFNDLNVALGTSFGDLENLRLMIRDGASSSLLAFPSPYEAGEETPFFETLAKEIKAFGAQIIILDSLYNFFQGNENNRVQVAQFIYLLTRLAKECDAALVFLSHPSKAGISGGDGYAGSTAWHDAVRSRLYLTEKETEDGQRHLVLETKKANYGPREGEIEVFYQDGLLVAIDDQKASNPAYLKAHCDTTFLDCLRESTRRGRHVTDARTASNFAPKIFTGMDIARGFSRQDFAKAMERLFNDKRIEKGTIMGKDRKPAGALIEVKLHDDINLKGEE